MSATNTKLLAGGVALAVAALVGLEGIPLTQEGKAKPYVDVAGVLTDCYGNTKNVKHNVHRTVEECQALMKGEADRIGSYVVRDQPNIPESVLGATISFAYNVGDGAYRSSTLRKHLKNGNYIAACNQLDRWVYITSPSTGRKVVSKGLQNRRIQEKALCLSYLKM